MTKVCNKCNKVKKLDLFGKRISNKDGRANRCKSCAKKYLKLYYISNKKAILEKRRKYRKKNIDYIISKDREYKNINKEKLKEKNEVYKIENEELIKERNKNYYCDNREYILYKTKEYNKNNRDLINEYKRYRYNNDPLYKLSNIIRSRIRNYIKKKGFNKDKETIDILSCEFDELMIHLNNNEYGFVFGDIDIDIDHIIPLSSACNIEGVYLLNKYDNLQLLPSYYNRYIKRDNDFDVEDFNNWLCENGM